MTHHKIEYDCKCTGCSGTGIYVGFAEHDGFGVVCHLCKGTGKLHTKIEYDDFDGREKRKGMKRVLKTNPGISVGVNKKLTLEINKILTIESFGGMSYKDWLKGKPFPPKSEMRKFTCPAWWYQSVDYKKKPKWCENTLWGRSFDSCKDFPCKDECWERFDKEEQNKAKD